MSINKRLTSPAVTQQIKKVGSNTCFNWFSTSAVHLEVHRDEAAIGLMGGETGLEGYHH